MSEERTRTMPPAKTKDSFYSKCGPSTCRNNVTWELVKTLDLGLHLKAEQKSPDDLEGSENSLYNIITRGRGHHTFVQTHKCATPRVNRKVSYGFWVMTTCPCGFSGRNNPTLLGSDAERPCVGAAAGGGGLWEISVPFSQFALNPKLL